MLNIVTVDDWDRTPNFGKQLANPSTILATPPLTIMGIRGYRVDYYGRHALFDIISQDTLKEHKKKTQSGSLEEAMSKAEDCLNNVSSVVCFGFSFS